jgi:hypothetical protein
LKKRSKKLLVLRALAPAAPNPPGAEVFLLLFFQKKKCLLFACGIWHEKWTASPRLQ